MIAYYQNRINTAADLEKKLEASGYDVGQRFLELFSLRDKPGKRETSVVGMLQFVSGQAWMSIFGKTADGLEKSTETANAYMIRESEPLPSHFISMPKELARLNVNAFVAGIIHGMLDASGFPCAVQAITVPAPDTPATGASSIPRDGTVFLIKFEDVVAAREASS